jgi:hypothetical protein
MKPEPSGVVVFVMRCALHAVSFIALASSIVTRKHSYSPEREEMKLC